MNTRNEGGKNTKKNGNTTKRIASPTTTTMLKPVTQKEPSDGDDQRLNWTNQARQTCKIISPKWQRMNGRWRNTSLQSVLNGLINIIYFHLNQNIEVFIRKR